MSPAHAQAKTITLCWAAWDPANALVELSKDFTAKTGINMKFEFVPWPNFADRFLNELNSKGKLCDLMIGDSQWIGGSAENKHYVRVPSPAHRRCSHDQQRSKLQPRTLRLNGGKKGLSSLGRTVLRAAPARQAEARPRLRRRRQGDDEGGARSAREGLAGDPQGGRQDQLTVLS